MNRSLLVTPFVLLVFVACSTKSSSTPDAGGGGIGVQVDAATTGEGGLVAAPTNVDCTKPANCYHLKCYDAPECAQTPDPGACPVGQVKTIDTSDGGVDGGDSCRACTEADCDGLPGFCCGADVCKNHVECGLFICANIADTCMG